ncbi:MAG: SPOR domain-containing protein, partial [Caulobacteraceae bacterium]|nr:SPOR domain-containing protein [Caulobacteraceae bacterium]
VVLGGNSTAARDNHVEDLLETGFDVIKRRKNGEHITIAQNLFEDEPTGTMARLPSEQGSGDQDGLKIVIGGEKDHATPSRIALAKAEPEKKGDWLVQVGAFRSRGQAEDHLQTVSKRFGREFAAYRGSVEDAVNGYFRARFTGFTAAGAQQACQVLTARKLTCMAIDSGR